MKNICNVTFLQNKDATLSQFIIPTEDTEEMNNYIKINNPVTQNM